MRTLFRQPRIFALMASLGIVSLLAISCGGENKDKPGPNSGGGGGGTTTETLSVSPSTLTLAGGASGTINITSNVAWTVSAPTGYTATPTSGSNNGTVKVTAAATATGGTLTVKGGSKSASVTLSTPAAAAITIIPESVSIPATAGTATFQINCAGSWTVTLPSPKPAWLTSVTPASGTGNATVTITTGNYTEKTKASSFLTVKSGSNTKYVTITKEAATNTAPTKPSGLKPSGSGIETITEFSWNASTDTDGDALKYTVMLSKDNNTWTSFDPTDKTTVLNKEEMEKNTTYYYKVVADDGFDGGKVESDVTTFTTGSTKSYWADGEARLYEVNSDGSITEVSSTSRPFKLVYTGDGYTQDLYKYGGQFDQEVDAGVKALFEIQPYQFYYNYFAIYKVAAYSNEAGMSQGATEWDNAHTKVDTKFKCSWAGGNSTGIGCNTATVISFVADNVPGMKGASDYETRTNISKSPISIVINANQYAGTNIWTSGNMSNEIGMISIAQTPARHPASGSYGGFAYTLRHEYGGHGIGLLGDEYVYSSSSPYPKDNESTFRYWQNLGAYCNTYLPQWNATTSAWYSDYENCNISLTPKVQGENWKSFADRPEYSACNISLHAGSATYGVGIYRSENSSCMINNIPHFNTISRWKIYCRIKLTAGETPDIEDFIAHDYDKTNSYGSAAPATKSAAAATVSGHRCEGPMLIDPYHKKPYFLK